MWNDKKETILCLFFGRCESMFWAKMAQPPIEKVARCTPMKLGGFFRTIGLLILTRYKRGADDGRDEIIATFIRHVSADFETTLFFHLWLSSRHRHCTKSFLFNILCYSASVSMRSLTICTRTYRLPGGSDEIIPGWVGWFTSVPSVNHCPVPRVWSCVPLWTPVPIGQSMTIGTGARHLSVNGDKLHAIIERLCGPPL